MKYMDQFPPDCLWLLHIGSIAVIQQLTPVNATAKSSLSQFICLLQLQFAFKVLITLNCCIDEGRKAKHW